MKRYHNPQNSQIFSIVRSIKGKLIVLLTKIKEEEARSSFMINPRSIPNYKDGRSP